ncbi:MAG: anti-anti-sigma factor [Sedimenticola sp.]|nr:anti-anti-sigma factor [Sedimenticola sp.]
MALKVVELPDEQRVVLTPAENFDFSINRDFSVAYSGYARGKWRFTVDLSSIGYLDSTAIGMLLQLAGHADGMGPVRVVNAPAGALELLGRIDAGAGIEFI